MAAMLWPVQFASSWWLPLLLWREVRCEVFGMFIRCDLRYESTEHADNIQWQVQQRFHSSTLASCTGDKRIARVDVDKRETQGHDLLHDWILLIVLCVWYGFHENVLFVFVDCRALQWLEHTDYAISFELAFDRAGISYEFLLMNMLNWLDWIIFMVLKLGYGFSVAATYAVASLICVSFEQWVRYFLFLFLFTSSINEDEPRGDEEGVVRFCDGVSFVAIYVILSQCRALM